MAYSGLGYCSENCKDKLDKRKASTETCPQDEHAAWLKWYHTPLEEREKTYYGTEDIFKMAYREGTKTRLVFVDEGNDQVIMKEVAHICDKIEAKEYGLASEIVTDLRKMLKAHFYED